MRYNQLPCLRRRRELVVACRVLEVFKNRSSIQRESRAVFALENILSSKRPVVYLSLITALGFILRITNISGFNIYPDSYILLLTAKNFLNRIPLSFLGKNGMFYDPPLNLSLRYTPLSLIVVLDKVFNNLEASGHFLSLVAGLFSIPLVYVFVSRLLDSPRAGLLASLFLALSFSHTAWSGYVMTETLAIFLILLSATFVAFSIKRPASDFADFRDMSAGVFAALAVFTRIEYAVLILALLFLYISRSERFAGKVLSFLASFLAVFAAAGIFTGALAEIIYTAPVIFRTHGLLLALTLFSWLLLCFVFRRKSSFLRICQTLSRVAAVSLCVLTTAIYLQIAAGLIGKNVFLWGERLTAVQIFSKYEFLIVITGLLGLVFLLLDDKTSDLGLFALIYIVPLAFLYNRTNPLSYRYSIHHLPVLILGASFFVSEAYLVIQRWYQRSVWQKMLATATAISFLGAVFVQTSVTARSMRIWQTATSYEKIAAVKTKDIIENQRIPSNSILLTFLAEPYYFYTNLASWRASNRYPYVTDDFPVNKSVLIVVDEATRDQLPEFSSFVITNLRSYQIDSFQVGLPYYFRAYHKDERNPVALYYLPAGVASRYLRVARDIDLR